MANQDWYELAIECGSKRKAEGLVHDHALHDPLRAVAGPEQAVRFAIVEAVQPPGVKRGKWRLSVLLAAERPVPEVVSRLAEALESSTGLPTHFIGERRPTPGGMTVPVRGDEGPWVRPKRHRKPYNDAELEAVLSRPPTDESVRTMAAELERTEDAISEIYKIASMQRGHLSEKMARGRFWRQVRRVAGKLGWLSIGVREYEDLLRDVRGRPTSNLDGPAWRIGRRTAEDSYEHAFDISYQPPDSYSLSNVVSLSSEERAMLARHFAAVRKVMVGGETEDGILWDGVRRMGPGSEKYFNASVFALEAPFKMIEELRPPTPGYGDDSGERRPHSPALSLDETQQRIEDNWEAAEQAERSSDGAQQTSLVIRRTYKIERWAAWDDELNGFTHDFHGRFGVYPNVMLANDVTYRRIDMAANKEHIRGGEGEVPSEAEHTPLSSFVGSEYELEFAMDDALGDAFVSLIYDTDPEGGGEPVPDEDTPEDDIRAGGHGAR